MYVSWGDQSVSYAIGIIGDCSVSQLVGTEHLYEIRGSKTSISYITLQTINNCVMGSIFNRRSSTPQIRYESLPERYFSYVEQGTEVDGWYNGTMTLKRRFADTTTTIDTTSLDYVSDGNTYKNEYNVVIFGLDEFIIKTYLTSPTTLEMYISHGGEMTRMFEIEYQDTDLIFGFINYSFNLYDFVLQHNNEMNITRAVITKGYNGEPYFDDNSFVATSGILSNYNDIPIFARDLYNKVVIENTINSTLHVPRNMLNGELINVQDLISETNTIIDEDTQELTKSKYEELYINFIDTYKVIDNNDKWTYQSSATARVVEEINNGFTDFRITNYRINYEDGTYKDRVLDNIILDGTEATITFNISCTGVKNVEFYDENYTTPFAMIDLSNYEGIYELEEKVKIE